MIRKILLVLLLAGTASFLWAQQEQQPLLGQAAPSFRLKGLDGKTYALEDFRGKYVVLHFATTWCPFCNAEAPYLEKLYQTYKDKGVQVLIVDVKENEDLVAKWAQPHRFSFPVLLDTDGAVATAYAPPDVLPDLARDEVVLASNLIIDRNGHIRFYSLLNTTAFDAKLVKAQQKLDELLNSE